MDEQMIRKRFQHIINGEGLLIPRIAVKKAVDDLCKAQPPTSEPPSELGWISVKDRMPQMIKTKDGHQYSTSQNVLWWDKAEGVFISCLNSDGSIHIDPGFNINPSHWMPLPQGPIKEPT